MTAGIGLKKMILEKLIFLILHLMYVKKVVEDTVAKLSREKIKGKYYRIYIK